MKKILSFAFIFTALLLLSVNARSQTLKIGVFDVDVMVQAMPGYHIVDSLMQIFDRDSLGSLREYYESEYQRLDSTYKADSAQVAAGKKSKAILDMVYCRPAKSNDQYCLLAADRSKQIKRKKRSIITRLVQFGSKCI